MKDGVEMKFMYYALDGHKIGEWTVIQLEHHILQHRRKELGYTQKQVADKANILVGQYQRMESGDRLISGSSGRILLSVCEVLKLDPYLFFGKGNEKRGKQHLILPPIEKIGLEYAIPQYAYFLLVSAIPEGMICSDDDIMSCLRTAYGNDSLEVKPDKNSSSLYLENSFPYWRVVSQRGYLINSIYSSKEKQKEMLTKEGFQINQTQTEGMIVEDYKLYMFDLNELQITVMKSNEQLAEELGMNL